MGVLPVKYFMIVFKCASVRRNHLASGFMPESRVEGLSAGLGKEQQTTAAPWHSPLPTNRLSLGKHSHDRRVRATDVRGSPSALVASVAVGTVGE